MKAYKVTTKIKCFWKTLHFSLLILVIMSSITNCTINKSYLFSQKKTDDIYISLVDRTKTMTIYDTVNFKPTFDVTIRIYKKIDNKHFVIREYYGSKLYAIGEIKENEKIDLWITFYENRKIAEEYWMNGKIVWYNIYDSNGSLIRKVNIGIDAENF